MSGSFGSQLLKDLSVRSFTARDEIIVDKLTTNALITNTLRYGTLDPPLPNTGTFHVTLSGSGQVQLTESGSVVLLDSEPKTIILPDLEILSNRVLDVSSNQAINIFVDQGEEVRVLKIDDGFLYVGGSVFAVQNVRTRLGRIDLSTGTLDETWLPNFGDGIRNIAIDTSVEPHMIYVVGDFVTVGGVIFNRLVRIPADSPVGDVTWNPDLNSIAVGLTLDIASNFVYIGGIFSTVGGVGFQNIARIPRDSPVADVTWNPGADNVVFAITVDATESPHLVYIGGVFSTTGGQPFNSLARFFENSAVPDATWNPNVTGGGFFGVGKIAIDTEPSPKLIYIGGDFSDVGGTIFNSLARIPSNSQVPDASWNPNCNGDVFDIVLETSQGFLYVVGDFTIIGSTVRNRIARIPFTSPVPDSDWAPSCNDEVRSVTVDTAEGFVYAGGEFTEIDGAKFLGLARLYLELILLQTASPSQSINNKTTTFVMHSPSMVLDFYGQSSTQWALILHGVSGAH